MVWSSMSIVVMKMGEKYVRRISKRRSNDAINLLMLENDNGYHHVLIKVLNRLLGKSKNVSNPKELCPYCCWGFDKRYLKEGQIEKHMNVLCFLKSVNDYDVYVNFINQFEGML